MNGISNVAVVGLPSSFLWGGKRQLRARPLMQASTPESKPLTLALTTLPGLVGSARYRVAAMTSSAALNRTRMR